MGPLIPIDGDWGRTTLAGVAGGYVFCWISRGNPRSPAMPGALLASRLVRGRCPGTEYPFAIFRKQLAHDPPPVIVRQHNFAVNENTVESRRRIFRGTAIVDTRKAPHAIPHTKKARRIFSPAPRSKSYIPVRTNYAAPTAFLASAES